jgi:hypothetical protein
VFFCRSEAFYASFGGFFSLIPSLREIL